MGRMRGDDSGALNVLFRGGGMLAVVTTQPEGSGVWVRSRRYRPIVVPFGAGDIPHPLLEPDRPPMAAKRPSSLVCITRAGLTVVGRPRADHGLRRRAWLAAALVAAIAPHALRRMGRPAQASPVSGGRDRARSASRSCSRSTPSSRTPRRTASRPARPSALLRRTPRRAARVADRGRAGRRRPAARCSSRCVALWVAGAIAEMVRPPVRRDTRRDRAEPRAVRRDRRARRRRLGVVTIIYAFAVGAVPRSPSTRPR